MALIKIKQVSGLQTEVNKIVELADISSRDTLIEGNAASDATTKANTAESNAVATASSDATTKANTAESNAIAAAGSRDALVLSDAQGYANTAESNAVATADTAAGSRDALVLSTADTAAGSRDALVLSTADTAAGSRDALITSRVGHLEGVILEDNEMMVESYPGLAFGSQLDYSLVSPVQDNNVYLISAFVNGLRVEVASVDPMGLVTLANPGFAIDSNDTIVIAYQH